MATTLPGHLVALNQSVDTINVGAHVKCGDRAAQRLAWPTGIVQTDAHARLCSHADIEFVQHQISNMLLSANLAIPARIRSYLGFRR